MRLADLGARVIKIERPGVGDIGRTLAFAGLASDGDTLSFHMMNRNKESYAADLKNSESLQEVWKLVEKADVIIQNFRPGVIERLGLGYEEVKKRNPALFMQVQQDMDRRDLLRIDLGKIYWRNPSQGYLGLMVKLATRQFRLV